MLKREGTDCLFKALVQIPIFISAERQFIYVLYFYEDPDVCQAMCGCWRIQWQRRKKYGFANKLGQVADMVLPFMGLVRWLCRQSPGIEPDGLNSIPGTK